MLVALAGGVGGARLLAGLVQVVDPATVTAIVNTGDDTTLHGLHISPDIDTVAYTLAGLHNVSTGWGVATETWTVMDELERLGGETWFRLGDRDLATHLYRTERLAQGSPLHEVTDEIARARGVPVRILPMSDDPVGTRLVLAEGADGIAPGTEVDFQRYFVGLRHAVAVRSVRFEGAADSRPAPGVLDAIRDAEAVVVCPSNPVVSIGPILAVPGVRKALVARREHVVAVSPIVAGAALKGPADRLLTELGHESSVVGVARVHAEWVGTLVIDVKDAHLRTAVEAEGVRAVVAPTVMSSSDIAASLAATVLDAAR
ncbi:MAG TPA: 2-phospho-L-lactate transferase [Acidimicrobiales bacterium]|nr:2-phospho-L-lactate transferase [Acidimicrobiales bacterium]